MKAKHRYSLIAACIVIFLIGVPIIVIFVAGYEYNFSNGHFIKTGAISITTQPKGASISINGKTSGSTPKAVRFLTPGAYQVRVSKPNYFTWSKNLTVLPQQVTVADYGYDAITLLYSSPILTEIQSQGVNSFFAGAKRIVYTDGTKLYTADTGNPQNASSLDLPASLTSRFTISASADENYFLLQPVNGSPFIFSVPDNKIYELEDLLAGASNPYLQFGDNGNLYALENGNLLEIDWFAGKVSPVIQGGSIKSIYFSDHAIYALAQQTSSSGSSSDILERINPISDQTSTLYSGLPAWQNSSLIINQQNQTAILGDSSLYILLNSKAQQVEQYVQSIFPLPGSNEILYATKNEIGTENLNSGDRDVITRLSQQITSPSIALQIGWSFYISGGELNAIELNTVDGQNIYQLKQVDSDTQAELDPAGKYIYLLDNGNLERLQIR